MKLAFELESIERLTQLNYKSNDALTMTIEERLD
jgi:hypothetical protein